MLLANLIKAQAMGMDCTLFAGKIRTDQDRVRVNFMRSVQQHPGRLEVTQWLDSLIQDSMRFCVDAEVALAIKKMSATPHETLIKAFPYARLPHPLTWVEVPELMDSGKGSSFGFLMQETFENNKRQIHFFPIGAVAGVAVFNPEQEMIFSEDGFKFAFESMRDANLQVFNDMSISEEDKKNQGLGICSDALSILLLLNSRSQVIKYDGSEEKDRLAKNKFPRSVKANVINKPVGAVPIQFDISRLIENTQGGISEKYAKVLRAAQLVMGHFKVRQSGVFWWGHHWRNLQDISELPKKKGRVIGRDNANSTQGSPDSVQKYNF